MAQDEATFDFPAFKVHVRYIGEQNGPAYETMIEAPGFEPATSGVVLRKLPLLSSAARAAISEFRKLLAEGVQSFVDAFRQNSGVVSFKAVQNVRLVFLSWNDLASAIGDQALAAAQEQLKAQEPVEYKETYGREPEPESEGGLIPADATYDLGTVIMEVRVMGLVEGVPIWGVTASAPGSDIHANTILGMGSPLALHAAQGMIENLSTVLRLGVDRYFAEGPRAKRTPITPEKRAATETLYAVASQIGAEGLAEADQRATQMIQELIDTLEGQALADMEARIAEYRKRKPRP